MKKIFFASAVAFSAMACNDNSSSENRSIDSATMSTSADQMMAPGGMSDSLSSSPMRTDTTMKMDTSKAGAGSGAMSPGASGTNSTGSGAIPGSGAGASGTSGTISPTPKQTPGTKGPDTLNVNSR